MWVFLFRIWVKSYRRWKLIFHYENRTQTYEFSAKCLELRRHPNKRLSENLGHSTTYNWWNWNGYKLGVRFSTNPSILFFTLYHLSIRTLKHKLPFWVFPVLHSLVSLWLIQLCGVRTTMVDLGFDMPMWKACFHQGNSFHFLTFSRQKWIEKVRNKR